MLFINRSAGFRSYEGTPKAVDTHNVNQARNPAEVRQAPEKTEAQKADEAIFSVTGSVQNLRDAVSSMLLNQPVKVAQETKTTDVNQEMLDGGMTQDQINIAISNLPAGVEIATFVAFDDETKTLFFQDKNGVDTSVSTESEDASEKVARGALADVIASEVKARSPKSNGLRV
jgi:hypothetical protein